MYLPKRVYGVPVKAQRSGFDGERKNKATGEYLMLALNAQNVDLILTIWGFSSAGRAPALQAGGQRFDPANLHQAASRRRQFVTEREQEERLLLGNRNCYRIVKSLTEVST